MSTPQDPELLRPAPLTPNQSTTELTPSLATLKSPQLQQLSLANTDSSSSSSALLVAGDSGVITTSKSLAASDKAVPKLISSSASPEISKRTRSAEKRITSGLSKEKRVSSAREALLGQEAALMNGKRYQTVSAATDVWDNEVLPLLNGLGQTQDMNELCGLCDDLWKVLQEQQMLGPMSTDATASKRRKMILRSLFNLLHLKDPNFHMKLAKLILAVSSGCTVESNALHSFIVCR